MEHPAKIPVQFVQLRSEDICLELFQDFHRRQVVDLCWRKIDGRWQQKPDPFIDDWSQEDYAFLVSCLQNTVRTGGLVLGAFVDGRLKGFTSVEPGLFWKESRISGPVQHPRFGRAAGTGRRAGADPAGQRVGQGPRRPQALYFRPFGGGNSSLLQSYGLCGGGRIQHGPRGKGAL